MKALNRSKSSTNLFSRGHGVFGCLGQGDDLQDSATFMPVALPSEAPRIIRVSAGWGHSAAITHDARLLVFGRPFDFSNLLQINRLNSISPQLGRFVGRFTNFFGSDESKATQNAGVFTTPTLFDLDNVESVVCTAGLTATLSLDGRVHCFGLNRWGQCGHTTNEKMGAMHVYSPQRINISERVRSLDAGLQHCVAALHTGQVMSWGKGNRGQLGDGNNETSSVPVKVKLPSPAAAVSAGFNHSAALTEDGQVFVWGKGMSSTPKEGQRASAAGLMQVYLDQAVPRLLRLPGGRRAAEMCSSNFTLVIRADDGTLWAIGLGEDDRNCIPSPVPVQQAVNAALLDPSQLAGGGQAVSSPQVRLGPGAALRKGYQRVTLFDQSPGSSSTAWSTYADPGERVFEVVVHEGEAFLHPTDLAAQEKALLANKSILDFSHGWQHQIAVFE